MVLLENYSSLNYTGRWLAISSSRQTSWPSLPLASRNATGTEKCDRNSGQRFYRMACPDFGQIYYVLIIYTHCWELMESVGSHGSLSLLFMMKVMVWHVACKVMTAIAVVEISLGVYTLQQLFFWPFVGTIVCTSVCGH
jgi:hypothetical protein